MFVIFLLFTPYIRGSFVRIILPSKPSSSFIHVVADGKFSFLKEELYPYITVPPLSISRRLGLFTSWLLRMILQMIECRVSRITRSWWSHPACLYPKGTLLLLAWMIVLFWISLETSYHTPCYTACASLYFHQWCTAGGVFLSWQCYQIIIQELNMNCKCSINSSGLLLAYSYT